MLPGVYKAVRKNQTEYYRASITFHNKHVSLGSFATEQEAHEAYQTATELVCSDSRISQYPKDCILPFAKWVSLINFRDNGIYIKTPIYLQKKYFEYYLTKDAPLKFDVDDLFYYSHHTIMARKGYLFVADYGMQVNILSRYGIRNHAVNGRDYFFANGDFLDYRYGNIVIINPYHGVYQFQKNGKTYYKVKIHINGDYVVGTYEDEQAAAIAYNKAVTVVRAQGVTKQFPENYVEGLSAIEYAKIYNQVKISRKLNGVIEKNESNVE